MRNLDILTTQENVIIKLVAQGLDNIAIGGKLGIKSRTVEHHTSAIVAKLQIPRNHNSRVGIVIKFWESAGSNNFVEELERLRNTPTKNILHTCHVFTSHLACEICHNIFSLDKILELVVSPEVQLPLSSVRTFMEALKEKIGDRKFVVKPPEENGKVSTLILETLETTYKLTERELLIAKLVNAGIPYKQIGSRLSVSVSYVGRIVYLLANKIDPSSEYSPITTVKFWYEKVYPKLQ